MARALASIATAGSAVATRVWVFDDGSSEELASLVPADTGTLTFTYRRNSKNLGFAGTVNEGLRATRGDVIILNTDVLVFDDWIARLKRAAEASADIATVTPLSNAATILSYPRTLIDNIADLELDWASLDALCKSEDAAPVDLPTGVGFCMYIKRRCLDAVGPFDAETFAAGYGEENDFCRRAAEAGWRNVAAPNVFVWHRGGGSFSQRRETLRAHAQTLLARRFPTYHSLVGAFIRADPLCDVRRRLDMGRIAATNGHKVLVLGRRAEPPVDEEQRRIYLQPSGPFWSRKWRPLVEGMADLPNLPDFEGAATCAEIQAFLVGCGIERMVIPRRSGIPRRLAVAMSAAANDIGLPISRAP